MYIRKNVAPEQQVATTKGPAYATDIAL